MSLLARLHILFVVCLGLLILLSGFVFWSSEQPLRFLAYLIVACLASGLRVSVSTVTGTLSLNFLFILIGLLDLSATETLFLGTSSTLLQFLVSREPGATGARTLFHVCNVAVAIKGASLVYASQTLMHLDVFIPGRMVLATAALFAMSSFQLAALAAWTEGRSLRETWWERHLWSFVYYLAGAAFAGFFSLLSRAAGWQVALLLLPVVYLLYRSYFLHVSRVEVEKSHAEEMASLHLRTIEALALAIEAKDHTTHDHLERVQVYAMEVGKEMGLTGGDLDALQAAALLHDIGKLAVPEHIISKPGRLTQQEFEKMKIHPVVGAEILERVRFPYPVVPIVRCHHEKWDGSGYPSGLKGEAIPIGARILSAVDCLDALATDRQYRLALPLQKAMEVVKSEAGKAFDPAVVAILERRYVELEAMARARSADSPGPLKVDLRIEKGAAPAAGFEETSHPTDTRQLVHFLNSVASARQDVQALFELTQELGSSLSIDETLSVLGLRLKRIVPYDAMAVYLNHDKVLKPEYVTGENSRLFSSLEIPVGQGLAGWVAENLKPIVNGNPSVEPGYLNDPNKFSTLRSAIAVPLEGMAGVVGVLSLYAMEKDAFSKDHLRVLQAIASKAALAIENALRYRQAETSATTDYLTGLPNARSLFLHLEGEIDRARRIGESLAVIVCDLDGFKKVNDRYGHLEGNQLLKTVAQGIRGACRERDYVARMGGDEFVLVLPGANGESAARTVDRLRDVAREAGLAVCGKTLVGLSGGIALYPEDGEDAEVLLATADRRMYGTKPSRSGKHPAMAAAL
ncbi:MAG: diguanylate cyclase [Bryobacteraceae bacterium]|nr:diguanylate cyclase [Bryobacteraceae bacterium]